MPANKFVLVGLLIAAVAVTSVEAGATLTSRKGKWCKLVRSTAEIEAPIPSACNVAILSGGSFIQLAKSMSSGLPGVYGVIKGYTGGYAQGNVSFADVCKGTSGHAEAVMVAYDADATNYTHVLRHYFDKHDPTVAGAMMATIGDETYFGSQYRSAVFVRRAAERTAFTRVLKATRRRLRTSGIAGNVSADSEPEDLHNVTVVTRGMRFDGVFLVETASDEKLRSIRAEVKPDPALRERYIRKMKKTALVAKYQETQGPGNDDALAREFERLDREGKLAGAAVRSSKKAWRLVNEGKVPRNHPDAAGTPTKADAGADITSGIGAPDKVIPKAKADTAAPAPSDSGTPSTTKDDAVKPPPPTTTAAAVLDNVTKQESAASPEASGQPTTTEAA
jgi:peptide methionine sulfoxide reductase MsrA